MLAAFMLLTPMSAQAAPNAGSSVDGNTSNSYKISLSEDGNTRYNGRVWTDKTVLNGDASVVGADGTTVVQTIAKGNSDFLVEYSALATSTATINTHYAPVDVVFVVDLSGSMYGSSAVMGDASDPDSKTRLEHLMASLNSSITSLIELNKDNRIGVVGYRSADTADVLLPFDSYDSVSFKADNAKTNTPIIEVGYRRNGSEASSNKSLTLGTDVGTNVQAGVAAGMGMLLNANPEYTYTLDDGTSETITRMPSLILMADGWATHSSPSETWWSNENQGLEESLGIGLGAYYGQAMKAMMTAASMKQQVNERYFGNEANGSDKAMRLYTLGFALDQYTGIEQQLALAMLNPAVYVKDYDGGATIGEQIYDAFESYSNNANDATPINTGIRFRVYKANAIGGLWYPGGTGGSVESVEPSYDFDSSIDVGTDTGRRALLDQVSNNGAEDPLAVEYDKKENTTPAWVMFNYDGYDLAHPSNESLDVASIDSLINYTDEYFEANDATDASKMFEDIIGQITTSRPQAPTETGGDDPEISGYITYTDPIGRYMQVDGVKALLFGNNLFQNLTTVEQDGTTIYTFAGTVDSPVYGDEDVNNIIISVATTGSGVEATDTLTIKIPAALIPLRTDTITYAEDGTIESNVSNGAMPLRVFYGVSLREGVLNNDGAVNVKHSESDSGIDPEYVEANIDESGNIKFFSNLFSGAKKQDENGADVTVGDATVTYAPDAENPFYYFQEDTQLYKDEGLRQPVTSAEELDDEAQYYFKIEYIVEKEQKTAVISREGSLLKSSVENGMIKAGSPRLGNLLDLVDISKQDGTAGSTGATNNTGTAQAYYYPEYIDGNGSEPDQIKVYQGNNGVVLYPAKGDLEITKTVNWGSASDEVKEDNSSFTFKVELKDSEGNSLTREYSYVVYDGSSAEPVSETVKDGDEISISADQRAVISGLPAGARYTVTEIKANQGGFITQDNSTGEGADTKDGVVAGSIVADSQQTAAFTNIYQIGGVLSGTKVWVDNSNAYGTRPNDIDLTLQRTTDSDPTESDWEVVDDLEAEGIQLKWSGKDDGDNSWTFTYTNLPTVDGNGTGYTYRVVEDELSGYEASYNGDTITITNTLTGTVTINGTKTWVDDSNAAGLRPDSIELVLYRSVAGGEEQAVDGVEPVWTKNGNTWSYEFVNMPAQDDNGNPYTYRVQEVVPSGYTVTYDGNNITNTLDEGVNDTVGSLRVTKQVVGQGGETDRNFSFTVTLGDLSINGTYGDMTFVNGVSTFTLRHGQSVVAEGLPAGIGYTVSEIAVDGYEVSAEGQTGVIVSDAVVTAAFTNSKEKVPDLPPDPPSDPEIPETPETPDTPTDPETPETPDTPSDPEVPETPDTPDDPQAPETPSDPDDPDLPAKPSDPTIPATGDHLTFVLVTVLGAVALVATGVAAYTVRKRSPYRGKHCR